MHTDKSGRGDPMRSFEHIRNLTRLLSLTRNCSSQRNVKINTNPTHSAPAPLRVFFSLSQSLSLTLNVAPFSPSSAPVFLLKLASCNLQSILPPFPEKVSSTFARAVVLSRDAFTSGLRLCASSPVLIMIFLPSFLPTSA